MKVLVTGATGYIAKHVVLQLLHAGHTVRASIRSKSRENELREALSPYLHERFDDEIMDQRLEVVYLDLMSDIGWVEAMQGVDALFHIASPCPTKEPRHEEEVIRPAIDGSMRAIKAAYAAGVFRVIATSSVAAVVNTDLPAGRTMYNESDWTDIHKRGVSAYVKSKTLAEEALWEFCRSHHEIRLTTILPSFVLGAPLDDKYGASVRKIEMLFKLERAASHRIPNYGYSCVDVHDIALMHLRALERTDECVGKRFIGSSRCFLWLPEMAQLLQDNFPKRNICTQKANSLMVRLKALFDPSLRYVAVNLEKRRELDNSMSVQVLGIDFRDPRQSLVETGAYLAKHN